jgi:hypothetical protein
MWTPSAAILAAAILLTAAVADAAPGEDRLCDLAIARAETRRNTIRTEVRRQQQSDSYEAAGLRIIDDLLKSAGRWRDRRDWRSCVWYAEEAYNFGRPGRPEPPLQAN